MLQTLVLGLIAGVIYSLIAVGITLVYKCSRVLNFAQVELGTLSLAQNALRSFLVVPKIGVGDACLESLQALTILWRVKDSSARA